MSETATLPPPLTRKDFVPSNEVRWCPGCGDYSILSTVQRLAPELGVARENFVIVSGIGCSSRFPYYLETFGLHSIHGRALPIATGVKCANPELLVIVATGDGDGLSIGGNHFLHTIRRNLDINILLFNNRIYGLTKGQASPTSDFGQKTKSTPAGTIEHPINPASVAIGAEASFVARTIDVDPKHMSMVIRRAIEHKGTSFVEIYQNCVIFNDGAFDDVAARAVRGDRMVYLEDGKPLIFGKETRKGIRIRGLKPEVVELPEGADESDLMVHHEAEKSATAAYMLSQMNHPEFPVPMGVLRCVEAPVYENLMVKQIDAAQKKRGGKAGLRELIYSGEMFEVK